MSVHFSGIINEELLIKLKSQIRLAFMKKLFPKIIKAMINV